MRSSTRSREKTLPISVGDMGFMLERLGRDCSPLQFLRELTQNSIEAIRRTGETSGTIQWDVDWNRLDLEGDGVYKLALVDSGDGMTGPEMIKYINQLSSSIAGQSMTGNYGVGAKIAAATRNHLGLIYLSWKNGSGSMIHLWRDPETRQYGLRQFQHPDGTFAFSIPVDDAVKPALIADHGTMVVLLGNSSEEDTMLPPGTATSPSRWMAKYLNTRYFRFPDGITVRAREGWENPRADTDRNLLRTVLGQLLYLTEHSVSSGTVQLEGAAARWWILRDEPALSQNSGFINSSGHIAALYRDELYEIESGRAGVARLQQFGIIFGYKQVVIYIEPDESAGELTTNTSRTGLLLDSEPLPWTNWGTGFREKLPAEVRELIESVAANAVAKDHSQTIRERLKQISDLFRLSRYRPAPAGELLIGDNARGGGSRIIRDAIDRVRKHTGSAGGRGGRAGDVYATFTVDGGQKGKEVQADPFPIVQWVSVADGTREPGFLEDRAARYVPELNTLQVNSDFRVFTDLVQRYCDLYREVPGASNAVIEVVHEWFEQSLVEAVLGVQTLDGAKEWTSDDINAALSDEALTAAVMPRYHVDVAIKRALGAKLGSLKTKS